MLENHSPLPENKDSFSVAPDWKQMNYDEIVKWISDNNCDLETFKKILSLQNNNQEKLRIIKKFLGDVRNIIGYDVDNLDLNILKEILPLLNNTEGKLSIVTYCMKCYSEENHKRFFSKILSLDLLENKFDDIFRSLHNCSVAIKLIEPLLNSKNIIITDNDAEQIFKYFNNTHRFHVDYWEIFKIEKDYHLQASNKERIAFEKFPLLYETLKKGLIIKGLFKEVNNDRLLPPELQEAINTKNYTAIAKYYGEKLTVHQLMQIPRSTNKYISGYTILKLALNHLINDGELPLVTDENRNEVEAQQKALCNVVNACFNLAYRLEFDDVIDQNNPNTYPEFLKNLIINTAKKGPKSWIETEKSLVNNSLPIGIENAINDYIKTIFLPHYLRKLGNENYDIDEVLKEFLPQALTKFFKDVAIDGICKLSNRWHEPGRIAELNKAKTFANTQWQPLFSGNSPTYKPFNIKIVSLINSTELRKEGITLKHCVGGYTTKCLKESVHILSLRDELGKPVSTIELQIKKGKMRDSKKIINIKSNDNYYLELVQHHGMNDTDPFTGYVTVAELFFDDIRSGKIKVDLAALEEAHEERYKSFKNPTDKAIIIIGYDHNDNTKDENGETPLEKAVSTYRKVGLDNGKKEKERETKDENKKKLKNTNVPKQLTSNFDLFTGRAEEKESKEQEVNKKNCLKIKDHILKICQIDQPDFSKDHINVICKKEKLYIKISATSLDNNLFSLSYNSLANLLVTLGNNTEQTIKTSADSSKKLITFMIDYENLPEIMKILQEKAPLKPNQKISKATMSKLANLDREYKRALD